MTRSTSDGEAPIAIRMPTSRVRCVTVYRHDAVKANAGQSERECAECADQQDIQPLVATEFETAALISLTSAAGMRDPTGAVRNEPRGSDWTARGSPDDEAHRTCRRTGRKCMYCWYGCTSRSGPARRGRDDARAHHSGDRSPGCSGPSIAPAEFAADRIGVSKERAAAAS